MKQRSRRNEAKGGTTPDDNVLIEQLRKGQTDALGILFDRYCRLIFSIAYRILRNKAEAEDLTQEVFLEIYDKADLYNASLGSVKIWLLQYAYHRSFNRRKYLALRGFYFALPNMSVHCVEQRGEHESMDRHDWRVILKLGMKELSEKQRQLIELVAFEGLTVREASVRLAESYVNGRNHYYRGLSKLKHFLNPPITLATRPHRNSR